MSVKMTRKQLIELRREGSIVIDGTKYTVHEVGDWEGAGEKYQNLEVIFTDGERFYSGTIFRSGSYFTDWNYEDYGDADINEVHKLSRIQTEWSTNLSTPVVNYDLLVDAAREFIRKCDCGQAKSKRSYAQFKAALGEQIEEAVN